MKHAAKRLLSACLALLLVVGLVPAALAAEPGVLTDTSGPATLTATARRVYRTPFRIGNSHSASH